MDSIIIIIIIIIIIYHVQMCERSEFERGSFYC